MRGRTVVPCPANHDVSPLSGVWALTVSRARAKWSSSVELNALMTAQAESKPA